MKRLSLIETITHKKLLFLAVFFCIFTLSYVILVAIDFVPESPAETTKEVAEVEESEIEIETPEPEILEEPTSLPQSIYIERLDKTVSVLNPASRSISDLDTALLSGVVRHPDSAMLNQDGNVFILGHSSYLPTVFNKNFQAFNGIQNLEWGDVIEVTSENGQVVSYRVEKVFQARAEDVTVPIAGDEKKLTLATCNSFGSTDDRYIVEAKQVDIRPL
jgi:LPXTG-site transpeptidase (sortase) family protein